MTGGAYAECPAPQDIKAPMERLIERVQNAPDGRSAARVSGEMWGLWLTAPNEIAQEVLDRGLKRREVFNFAGALEDFNKLIEYCPAFAEGYNQRAFVHYLTEDYENALKYLDIALELQPLHIAAQAGRGLTLMQLGRIAEAREQMLVAVANNPWLGEAQLLSKGAPLGPLGEDL